MKCFLAVDIGGTKTRLAVFTDREFLEESETVGVGLPVESNGDLPPYREALEVIANKYEISGVAVNLGGRNAEQVRAVTESVFANIPCTVVRESEGDAAYAFGASVGADIILLAGTGTIACSLSKKGKCILGGWGMNIGDGGSGYDIGLTAIKQTLFALDGVQPLTPLQKEISGLNEPIMPRVDAKRICAMRDEVRARLQHTNRRAVASLVKTVAKHAKAEEADALQIFQAAGEKMGELIVIGLQKAEISQNATVAVSGGLINALPYWQEAFENKIKNAWGVVRFVYDTDGLMRGIMKLAKEIIKE